MNDKRKQSVPALLRQDLSVVRENRGFRKRYLIKNRETGVVVELGEEEFYLIQLLSEVPDPAAVSRAFLAKFGKRITAEELADFTDYLQELGLTAVASDRPVAAEEEQAGVPDEASVDAGETPASDAAGEDALVDQPDASPDGGAPTEETVEPAGDATASLVDERRKWRRDRRQRKGTERPFSGVERRREKTPRPPVVTEGAKGVAAGSANRADEDQQRPATGDATPGDSSSAADIVGDEDAIVARPGGIAGEPSARPALDVEDGEAGSRAEPSPPSPRESARAARRERRKREWAEGAAGLDDSVSPTDTRDGEGMRSGRKRRFWILFNPDGFFETTSNLFAPFRYLAYLLPLLLPLALLALANNSGPLHIDIERLLAPVTLIQHLIFSLLTVNLITKLVTGMVTRYYGAEVKGFGIILAFGIIPRFFVTMQKAWELPRKARLWVFSAPLITKLFLFSAGVLLWLATRHLDNVLTFFFLTLWMTSIASFTVTANPLLMSDGYRLLSTYVGVKDLKAIARHRLFSWIRGEAPENPELSTAALVTYAVASTLFSVIVSVLIAFFVATWLQVNLQGVGIILAFFFLIYMARRGLSYMQKVREGLEEGGTKSQAAGGDAWRKRIKVKRRGLNAGRTRYRLAMLLILLPILFLPYPYETGGKFTLLPADREELHVEVEGLVEEVLHDGGEPLTKGTVIARLSTYRIEKELAVNEARLQETEAKIAELQNTPTPEQLDLAVSAVDLAKVQLRFSQGELARYEDLYKKKAVSLDDLEDARRRMEIDKQKLIEAEAKLALVKAGPHPEEIAAIEAERQRYQEQVNYYREELRRSTIAMPFDGQVIELNLRQKRGQYLKKGDLFTEVENSSVLFAAIEVPETDIGEVATGAVSKVKTWAYPGQPFEGEVTKIEPRVIEQPFGNVVKVMVRLDNSHGMLHSGMSGYAKIRSEERPVWEAFTRTIVRFAMVELWSWIP